jgi:chromosome segregation ATPase
MTDKDFNRLDPIVPESNERIGRGEGRGGQSANDRKRGAHDMPPRSGGSVDWFWMVLVLVLMIGLGGLSYFFVQETGRLALLQSRFDDLESKIVSTDESLNQSGAALGIKLKNHAETLDKHWSEIKKLWGVSNDRNRNKIEAQGKAIKSLEASRSARKKDVADLTAKLTKTGKSVDSMASASLAAKLEVNDMVNQSQELVDQLNSLKQSLKASQLDLKTRVAGNEEAINAIDAYRLQVNRDIQQIKQQLGATKVTQ